MPLSLQPSGSTDRQTVKWTDRQAGRQSNRQTDRQTGRQTDRDTDRYSITHARGITAPVKFAYLLVYQHQISELCNRKKKKEFVIR